MIYCIWSSRQDLSNAICTNIFYILAKERTRKSPNKNGRGIFWTGQTLANSNSTINSNYKLQLPKSVWISRHLYGRIHMDRRTLCILYSVNAHVVNNTLYVGLGAALFNKVDAVKEKRVVLTIRDQMIFEYVGDAVALFHKISGRGKRGVKCRIARIIRVSLARVELAFAATIIGRWRWFARVKAICIREGNLGVRVWATLVCVVLLENLLRGEKWLADQIRIGVVVDKRVLHVLGHRVEQKKDEAIRGSGRCSVVLFSRSGHVRFCRGVCRIQKEKAEYEKLIIFDILLMYKAAWLFGGTQRARIKV